MMMIMLMVKLHERYKRGVADTPAPTQAAAAAAGAASPQQKELVSDEIRVQPQVEVDWTLD